jgi:transcriptional regulator with XRE-family HTH domain
LTTVLNIFKLSNMKQFPPDFGQQIRYRRLLLDLTQDEVAEPCGLDKARLSRMERGTYCPPGLPTLRRMARILKIPLNSTEFKKLLNLAMEARVGGALKTEGARKIVRVHMAASGREPSHGHVRMRENPRRVYPLQKAFARAKEIIRDERDEVVDARLHVRTRSGKEWVFDVELSDTD